MSERKNCGTCKHEGHPCEHDNCREYDEWEPRVTPPPPRREIAQIAVTTSATLFVLDSAGTCWFRTWSDKDWTRLPDLPQE